VGPASAAATRTLQNGRTPDYFPRRPHSCDSSATGDSGAAEPEIPVRAAGSKPGGSGNWETRIQAVVGPMRGRVGGSRVSTQALSTGRDSTEV
jgi:hypothetical protein